MSGDRARRLNRIVEIRQRELDQEAAHLARAHFAETEAKTSLDEAQAQAAAAFAARATLSQATANASEWTAREAWLASQRLNEERASERRVQAAQAVDEARASVVKMRVRVRGIETLVERVEESEREAQAQADRKFEDELASQTKLAGPTSR